MTTAPVPSSHVAVALHAVTAHMVNHDLPVFVEMRPVADRIEVFLFERPFDSWVSTVTNQSCEVVGLAYPSGAIGVHVDANLPETGVRVRLRSSRQVAPSPGRRRLESVSA